MNLADNLVRSAQQRPDGVALKLDDAVLTYAEFDRATQQVAGFLRGRGVEPGDTVGLMLPNVPQWAVLYFGVLRIGAVAVPLNPLLKGREVEHYLTDSGAKILFAWESAATGAREGAQLAGSGAEVIEVTPTNLSEILGDAAPVPDVVQREGHDTAVVLYTSGTTGKPKGAELTHDNLIRNAAVSGELMAGSASGESLVVFGGLPLFHVFGQTCGLNVTVERGGTLTLLPRFDPEQALEIIERDGVTLFQGVPTMYIALAHARSAAERDVSSVGVCVSGGAALPGEVISAFEARFPGTTILEGYGLSETSPVASFNLPGRRKVGSIGVPIDGVEMRILDDDNQEVPTGEVGEVCIRGHNVMKGYLNRPEATETAIVDGWFHTGDVGRVDEEGFFFIVDRKKELIIRGGYNVYPREIEEVLYEHPAVAEAAVVGVPHETHGEEVAAAVSLKPDASADPDELRAYVKERVAAYKYPRVVQVVDALPKGPTGKILKREITIEESQPR